MWMSGQERSRNHYSNGLTLVEARTLHYLQRFSLGILSISTWKPSSIHQRDAHLKILQISPSDTNTVGAGHSRSTPVPQPTSLTPWSRSRSSSTPYAHLVGRLGVCIGAGQQPRQLRQLNHSEWGQHSRPCVNAMALVHRGHLSSMSKRSFRRHCSRPF